MGHLTDIQDMQPARNGRELIIEFLATMRTDLHPSSSERIIGTLVQHIRDTYHCAPEELLINDDEANALTKQLFSIANQRELDIARLPMTSR